MYILREIKQIWQIMNTNYEEGKGYAGAYLLFLEFFSKFEI